MKKILLNTLIATALFGQAGAQNIFSYGNNNVSVSEFLRVYEKNNAAQKVDYSEKALREYVELYSLFKMKVAEANKLHLDTSSSVASEIDNYRRQLSRGFLTDEEMVNKLVAEAYERSKFDLRVAHIILQSKPGKDSSAQRKTMDSLYQQISKGKLDFATAAKNFSDDLASKNQGGDIGYITGLQTVYAFENVAYNTAVGKVSSPFSTSYGYHILKVLEKRPARGQVKVAHILLSSPKSAGDSGLNAAKARAELVLKELKSGASFESLVTKYSDDKFSKDKNGELDAFGVGRMVPTFEEAAFGLKKPGDISKPVHTEYGYHIIKLLESYPLKPFEEVKKEFKSKVDNDARAQQARDLYFQKVKSSNGYKETPNAIEQVIAQIGKIADTGKDAGAFNTTTFSDGGNKTMFSLAGKNYTQNDFIGFAVASTRGKISGGSKEAIFRELYTLYQSKVVNDFQEHKLVEENPDFKSLMQEYKDGIMLFELMDRNVWGKASKDTLGLKAFFETQKDKYMWEPGFEGAVYTFKEQSTHKELQKLLAKKDVTNETLIKTMNSSQKPDALNILVGRTEFQKFTDIPKEKIVEGKLTDAYKKGDGWIAVKADKIYKDKQPKSFVDARGYIISSYQDKLEKDWNASLRSQYPVQINEAELKKLVK